MPIMFNNGAILFKDGKIQFHENLCCGYRLIHCDGVQDIWTKDDMSTYVGNVVKLSNDECYTVQALDSLDCNTPQGVSVTDGDVGSCGACAAELCSDLSCPGVCSNDPASLVVVLPSLYSTRTGGFLPAETISLTKILACPDAFYTAVGNNYAVDVAFGPTTSCWQVIVTDAIDSSDIYSGCWTDAVGVYVRNDFYLFAPPQNDNAVIEVQ